MALKLPASGRLPTRSRRLSPGPRPLSYSELGAAARRRRAAASKFRGCPPSNQANPALTHGAVTKLTRATVTATDSGGPYGPPGRVSGEPAAQAASGYAVTMTVPDGVARSAPLWPARRARPGSAAARPPASSGPAGPAAH
jgi:hypothetical protein